MDTQRPTKTLADYMIIAISPALIMVMVHSVCFFLADVFYRGEAIGGVRWVLFWFVLAVVLIARIGIEQGDGHAMVYGILLALATWCYLSTVQPNVVFGALLLAMVWFTAHKLTSNCTLIDEEADASGQGLLQSIARLPQKFKRMQAPVAQTPAAPQFPPPLPVSSDKTKTAKSQIPGIWLIYFSLAALPIFGLGQVLLPAGDMAARHRGFIYLFLYLAAALGLLVTTSFLGLRRYLRQRYLVMPGNIAFGWVQFGLVGAAIVLCLTLLLPRPGAGEAWGALRYHVDYQLHRASQFAARFNPHGTGSGRAGNQSSPGSPSPQSGQAPNSGQGQNGSASNHGGQDSSSNGQKGTPHGQENPGNPEKPFPNLSPPAGAIYAWIKILFWLIAIAALIWLLFRYRAAILMALQSMWTAIRKFIADLLGWFRPKPKVLPQLSKSAVVPPFRTFENPFLTGDNHSWLPQKLIIYSYEALQSWAIEQDTLQGSPQTPREFCRQLGEEMPEATGALEHLAYLYGHVVYGASLPGQYHPEYLRQLWDLMSSPRQDHLTGAPGRT
jgi:hypothetical protein